MRTLTRPIQIDPTQPKEGWTTTEKDEKREETKAVSPAEDADMQNDEAPDHGPGRDSRTHLEWPYCEVDIDTTSMLGGFLYGERAILDIIWTWHTR